MKQMYLLLFIACTVSANSQSRKIAVIGSSTAAGLAVSAPDSSWVRRINYYYKYQLGKLDTIYNLGVSGTNLYAGTPNNYVSPGGRPVTDPVHNVSRGVNLLSDLSTPANGVVIVNFPSGGYDSYSVSEIMNTLQLIYDSSIHTGNRCYITTTQPRTDGAFASSAIKRKLADIKDSIINRFGIANTLNFWDGMYNPADTTILTAYAAGDNVHFNNAGHRELFNRVVAKNIFNLTLSSSIGDYRSNVAGTGAWSSAASWQVYDGTTWVAATVPPTSSDGVVTIRTGQRIDMTAAVNFDQVVVETGANLYIYNSSTPTTFTLNDGAGIDIEVNGNLFVSINSTLTGTGSIQNDYGGVFTLRNQGVLSVNALNLGVMNVSGTGNIQNATLINNGVFTLLDFTLNLNNATLINNDSISLAYNANTYFAGTGGGAVTNSSGAVIFKSNVSGIARFNSSVALTNNGIIKGTGECQFVNTIVNAGNIAPGNTTGSFTINPSMVTGKSPTLNLELNSTGAVAGTNYDQLTFSTVDFLNTNITGAILQVTDNAFDPVGTVYTIITDPSGTITGPFASVTLSPSLGNIVYSSHAITVQKVSSSLPLTWGVFTATPINKTVQLEWSTLQEANTSHFVIEYAASGQAFTPVGTVSAAGNSSTTSFYSFTHAMPSLAASNQYRIRQVDLDGRSTYSSVRSVRFNEPSMGVQAWPNPMHDVLNLTINKPGINILIADLNGKIVRSVPAATGTRSMDVRNLSAGIYSLIIYENQQRTGSQKLIKID